MLKKFLLLTFGLALYSQVFASVGSVSLLRGEADILRDAQTLKGANLMPIENKDSIKTKEKTKMQLVFDDDTAVTLGSLTSFSVDEYLEDNNNSKLELSVMQGAFRVITGKIGKVAPKRFRMRIPRGFVGVRGTIFVGEINPNSDDYIVCVEGEIVVTSDITSKSITLKSGEMVSIGLDGGFEKSLVNSNKFSLLPNSPKKKSSSHQKSKNKEDNSQIDNSSKTPYKNKQSSKALSDKQIQNSFANKDVIDDLIYDEKLDSFAKNSNINDSTSKEELDELIKAGAIHTYTGGAKGYKHSVSAKENIQADATMRVDFSSNQDMSLDLNNIKGASLPKTISSINLGKPSINANDASLQASKDFSSLNGTFRQGNGDKFDGKYMYVWKNPNKDGYKIDLDLELSRN